MSSYQFQFEVLVSHVGSITQDQKIQLFLSGLQDYTAVEVELHQPVDLAISMSISRLYEQKSGVQRSIGNSTARPPSQANSRMIKHLTREEMADRHSKGLCFNYEEPFNQGHQCKKLFRIELTDNDGQESDSTEINFLKFHSTLSAVIAMLNHATGRRLEW